jgi:hypothetical protein
MDKTKHRRKEKIEQNEPTKFRRELRYSGRESTSCSTSGTRRAYLVTITTTASCKPRGTTYANYIENRNVQIIMLY